jgi:hypothetical protein
MGVGNMSKQTAAPWSFSKIKAFEQCPLQFYNERVLKRFPQKESEAMLYGSLYHEAAEEYVRDGTPLPKSFEFSKPMLDNLIAKDGDKLCEQKMGLTKDLKPTGFYDTDVWWRGIADLNIIDGEGAYTIDYKTGSKKGLRYADKGQLELMALSVFIHFPEVQTIKAGLLFVVADAMVKDKYTRDDTQRLWVKWINKFDRMESAFTNDVWNAHQSGLCKAHCPVLECAHNGRA